MILKILLNRFVDIILKIRDNSILIGLCVCLFSFAILISSFKTMVLTLIPFVIFLFVILGAFTISIYLTLFNLRLNSIIKRLGLPKAFEIILYFSLIVFIFFKINYLVSFSTNEKSLHEICKGKITHNLFGDPIYKIYIYDHQFDDWSSSGWVYVDSLTYYGRGDYISINLDKGIFGFNVIPKNQVK